MDRTDDKDRRDPDVGYKQPPKHSRWRPGQCGNPDRKRSRHGLRADVVIDQLLAKRFKIKKNGKTLSVTGYEAILRRLVEKELAGDRQAIKVRLKYMEMAPSSDGAEEILIQSFGSPLGTDGGDEGS